MKKLISLFLILLTFFGCGTKKEIIDLDNGIRLKIYDEILGFMDAMAVCEVYHVEKGTFFDSEKLVGYAIKMDGAFVHCNTQPLFRVENGSLIVEKNGLADTLLIRNEKKLPFGHRK